MDQSSRAQVSNSFLLPRLSTLLLALATAMTFTGFAPVASAARDGRDPSFDGLSNSSFRLLDRAACRADYSKIQMSEILSPEIHRVDHYGPNIPGSVLKSWAPTGSWDQLPRPECRPEWLEKAILSNARSPNAQAAAIQNYFNTCDASLSRNYAGGLTGLMSLSNARYQLCDHPGIRKVVIKLNNGSVVRGFLALKPGNTPRPFIILKCGVFCNAGDMSHRFMMMHLFDSSPFNILAVGNLTGADYVRDNGFIAIGGLDEGAQILRLARMVQDSPLRSRISSMHFAGVSLGAHGGLFAAYMNPYNLSTRKTPMLSSALALCPVVDLEGSVNDLFTSPYKRYIAKWVFVKQIFNIVTSVPILREIFPDNGFDPRVVPSAVADQALAYYSKLNRGWNLPPFDTLEIKSTKDLWKHNLYTGYLSKPIKTPTLAMASEDDPVVSTPINANILKRALNGRKDDGANVVIVKQGSHCAFNETYGWPVATTLYRSFILSHSPEFSKRKTTKLASLPLNRISWWSKLFSDEKYHIQQITFSHEKPVMNIRFRIYSPSQGMGGCAASKSYEAKEECFRWSNSEIPLAELHFPDGQRPLWAYQPRNATEAEALSRWANANMVVINERGEALEDTRGPAVGLRWTEY